MAKYFDELTRAMKYLGSMEDTIFLGQAVEYKGTGMTNTLREVSRDKLMEMPVNEDMQLGITNGLAIAGMVKIINLNATNYGLYHFSNESDC